MEALKKESREEKVDRVDRRKLSGDESYLALANLQVSNLSTLDFLLSTLYSLREWRIGDLNP